MSPVHNVIVRCGRVQASQHRFSIVRHFFQLFIGSFRFAEFHHLHFMELVHPDQSSCVASCASGFRTERRTHRCEIDRQICFIHDFIAIIVRQRNFRRRNQREVALIRQLEYVLFEFRELSLYRTWTLHSPYMAESFPYSHALRYASPAYNCSKRAPSGLPVLYRRRNGCRSL